MKTREGIAGAISPVAMSGRRRKRTLRQHAPLRYGTFEVAALAGVTWRTIYNWLRAGKLPEPDRGTNGRRLWTAEVVGAAIALGARRRKKGHAKNRGAEPEGRDG